MDEDWPDFEAALRAACAKIDGLTAALNIIASGMQGDRVLADWEMSNIAAAAVAKSRQEG